MVAANRLHRSRPNPSARERRPVVSGPNSAGDLLQLFRTGAVATRGELQQVTGLSRSTVTLRIDALLGAG
jgi:hypothetical protein